MRTPKPKISYATINPKVEIKKITIIFNKLEMPLVTIDGDMKTAQKNANTSTASIQTRYISRLGAAWISELQQEFAAENGKKTDG